jgi:hypothetical protein
LRSETIHRVVAPKQQRNRSADLTPDVELSDATDLKKKLDVCGSCQ